MMSGHEIAKRDFRSVMLTKKNDIPEQAPKYPSPHNPSLHALVAG
jgi:hypothetical protein